MSNWSLVEVNRLDKSQGGGNAIARSIYFARLDPKSRCIPSKGDKLEKFKEFIHRAYIDLEWHDPNGASSMASQEEDEPVKRRSGKKAKAHTTKVRKKRAFSRTSEVEPPVAVPSDDFDFFAGASVSNNGAVPGSSSQSGDLFGFSSAAAPSAAPAPAAAPACDFGDFMTGGDAFPSKGGTRASRAGAMLGRRCGGGIKIGFFKVPLAPVRLPELRKGYCYNACAGFAHFVRSAKLCPFL